MIKFVTPRIRTGERMTRRKKDPLRDMSNEERTWLERISRSQSVPVSHVLRANWKDRAELAPVNFQYQFDKPQVIFLVQEETSGAMFW